MSIYERTPQEDSQACIIWMHGLGSDAQNMMGVAEAFPSQLPCKHVFIDAPVRTVTINNHMPMRAWYDIVGVKLTDREDKAGIQESATLINEVIDSQIGKGFQPQQIFLAGFSQGGAMALYTGINRQEKLGGIISLSAYIPLVNSIQKMANPKLAIFFGLGEDDQIVLPTWTRSSYAWLQQQGFNNLTIQDYPMEHSICFEEIRDLCSWLQIQISASVCNGESK